MQPERTTTFQEVSYFTLTLSVDIYCTYFIGSTWRRWNCENVEFCLKNIKGVEKLERRKEINKASLAFDPDTYRPRTNEPNALILDNNPGF